MHGKGEILFSLPLQKRKIKIKSCKDQKSGDRNHCTEVSVSLVLHQKKMKYQRAYITTPQHKKKVPSLLKNKSFSSLHFTSCYAAVDLLHYIF